jgi:hypothetical protein
MTENDIKSTQDYADRNYNVPTLGEGGDFNHKCRCGERMLNIAVIVERNTAPPLLPNVCYRQ